MDNYQEMKEDLKRLGFKLYSGCRNEAWEHANEIGISTDEIVVKFSDDDVLRAIHDSARVMGMLAELEDEITCCPNCGVEADENDLMECERCGNLFCDDCGVFPMESRYCSIYCLEKDGKYVDDTIAFACNK